MTYLQKWPELFIFRLALIFYSPFCSFSLEGSTVGGALNGLKRLEGFQVSREGERVREGMWIIDQRRKRKGRETVGGREGWEMLREGKWYKGDDQRTRYRRMSERRGDREGQPLREETSIPPSLHPSCCLCAAYRMVRSCCIRRLIHLLLRREASINMFTLFSRV